MKPFPGWPHEGFGLSTLCWMGEVHDLRGRLRAALAAAATPTPEPMPTPALALHEAPAEYATPPKVVLFISGLEYSIPYADPEAQILTELNMGRELFPRDAPHPLIIWLPDYALTALARHAPDFWAWRSGVFEFPAAPQQRQQMYAEYTQQDSDWLNIDNLGVEAKLRRRRILESLLDEYDGLPDEQPILAQRKDIYFSLAQINQALNDLPIAIDYHQRYLALCRALDDHRGEGWALGNLGNAYADLGRVEEAIGWTEQALTISREIGDRRDEGNRTWNLGLVFEKQRRYAEAAKLIQICVDYEREIGHPNADPDAKYLKEVLRARFVSSTNAGMV